MQKQPPKTPVLTIDGIVLHEGKVLMLKRAIDPFKGHWVLPGMHAAYGERVEETAKRKFAKEIGVEVEIKDVFGMYSDPDRDPRYHTASVVYILQPKSADFKPHEGGEEIKLFQPDDLPEKVGFDHRRIIEDFRASFN